MRLTGESDKHGELSPNLDNRNPELIVNPPKPLDHPTWSRSSANIQEILRNIVPSDPKPQPQKVVKIITNINKKEPKLHWLKHPSKVRDEMILGI